MSFWLRQVTFAMWALDLRQKKVLVDVPCLPFYHAPQETLSNPATVLDHIAERPEHVDAMDGNELTSITLRCQQDMPTFCHYCLILTTAQMWMVASCKARIYYIGH